MFLVQKWLKKLIMKDSHPDIDEKIHELYSKLSPQGRFYVMLSMCQTERKIILSQMPESLTGLEKRKKLFEIYYRRDFTEEAFIKF